MGKGAGAFDRALRHTFHLTALTSTVYVESNEKRATRDETRKPEVVQATTATTAIRQLSKFGTVMDGPSTLPKQTINAYAGDE